MSKAKSACCAPQCQSGRVGCSDIVNWHGMKEHWVPYFPDVPWKYSAWSKLCSKHFQEYDHKSVSSDKNAARLKKNGDGLLRRTLKPEAIPSLWPNIDQEKLKPVASPRPTEMSSAEARKISVERLETEKDTITNLEQLNEKKCDIPSSFHKIREAGDIIFIKLSAEEGGEGMSKIITSLKIFEDLHFQLWCRDEKLNVKDIVYGIDEEPTTINSYSLLSKVLYSLDVSPDTETIEKTVDKFTVSRK